MLLNLSSKSNLAKLRKTYKTYQSIIFLLLNLLLATTLYYFFLQTNIVTRIPNKINLIKYDATWFDSIRQTGYTYAPGQMSNMAFFPLFAYFWKWSTFNALSISFLNLTIFLCAFKLVMGDQKYSPLYLLIISSLPCFVFFFLPYSEACFFLFGGILIQGYNRQLKTSQIIGIFGCCLTRSVSTFFIPAIILTEILANRNGITTRKECLKNITVNTLVCLASIVFVVIVQGLQTHKWFYYIEVQKYWQRHWLIPSLPLTTVSPAKVLGIDAAAFILGIIAIYFVLKWVFILIKKTTIAQNSQKPVDYRAVYFSALFLSAIVIVDTCFTYNINGRTNMQCMNRHLMCTPFAICFLNWLNKTKRSRTDDYFILGIIFEGIFITGVLHYYQHLIYLILFCYSFFFLNKLPQVKGLAVILSLLNLFFIVIFYQDFLSGYWVG